MPSVEARELQPVFEQVRQQDADLLPVCRWLAAGPPLAELVLDGERGREPSVDELVKLLRLLALGEPALRATGRWLVAKSEHAATAEMEHGLDQLIATDPARWSHPTQVLPRPCPEFHRLLAACLLRLEDASGEARRQLEEIREKLERAVRIEESARRRRAGQPPES